MKHDYTLAWSNKNAVDFYSQNRNCLRNVYNSEKYFLRKILEPRMAILDVGCAAGGFYNIFKSYERDISYTGVDISKEMIRKARNQHPNVKFFVCKGNNLLFDDNSFDFVFCSGAVHMNLNWREILSECWRVAKKHCLFDLRLTEGESIENIQESYQKIVFQKEWDGHSIVPYIVLNIYDAMSCINKLKPGFSYLESYGYMHKVSKTVVSPFKEVCVGMFHLRKDGVEKQKVVWRLPY